MYQIVTLNSAPNQSLLANLTVNGAALKLNLKISFNEIAQYWSMQISDVDNNILIASIPLLTGSWPAANILSQYQYKNIGSAYVLNVSNGDADNDFPNTSNLGVDFQLLWGDNV